VSERRSESVENFRPVAAFRALHEGLFVIPESMGCRLLRGTCSSSDSGAGNDQRGLRSRRDCLTPKVRSLGERNLAYISDIAEALDVPVNADFGVWLRSVTEKMCR